MKGKPLTLLLVEDNEDHAEIVRRSFRSHRVANSVRFVPDGEAALDYLLRRAEYSDPKKSPRPDVILLDQRLPKVDGLEVLKEIKQNEELHRIPVVVLTSSDEEHDVATAYDFHANSYVVKPLDFRKFTDLMQDLGFYWLGWNTRPFVQKMID
jgi:CheY-like chemotaxis protein